MASRIVVLGDGAWGIAVALWIAQSPERHVRIWSRFPESCARIRACRQNQAVLPGVIIPDSLELTADPAEAFRDAELLISAVPTIYLRDTVALWKPHIDIDAPIVSLTKGIEVDTFQRPSEILREQLGSRHIYVMSGPSHAEEVSRGMPTSLVLAGHDAERTTGLQSLLSRGRIRIYTNNDLIGVELAGALKNVIGIAAGICDGLGNGENAKSALLTRGLVDMIKFGVAFGAKAATFTGLAGLGDLVTTCFSPHGRNRRLGERLGRGEALSDIVCGAKNVFEGVSTSRSVYERSRQMGLELPIMTGVYRVLFENLSPKDAVRELMQRPPASEQIYFEDWPT